MSRSTRRRQTRLTFSPLPSSSPASKDYSQQIRDRAAAVTFDSSNPRKRRKVNEYFSGDVADQLPTPPPTTTLPISVDAADSDSDDFPVSSSRRKRSTQSNKMFASSPLSKPSSSVPRPKPTSHRLTRSQAQDISDDSDSDVFPTQRQRKAIDNLVDLGSDEESEASDVPVTPARQRKCARRPVEVESDASPAPEENVLPRNSRRVRKRRDHSDHEQNEVSSQSGSERMPSKSHRKSAHVISRDEQDELDDDLRDLASSSASEAEIDAPRTLRSPKAKSTHQLALEKLKRRREAGTQNPTGVITLDSDDEVHDEDAFVVSDDDDGLPASSVRDMFEADEEDEDFLTDGEDDTLGAPEALPMPLKFTRYASAKPKELFRHAVEWMVQKKLNPAFTIDDEIYTLAFDKLDDEVKGLAGSKYESSAWRPDFIYALRARPDMLSSKIHVPITLDGEKCDACNRSGHTPTFEVQFHGRPYHKASLELVVDPNDEDDSGDDDDQDRIDRDTTGRVIVPEAHSFRIGKFCMANAETAHTLQHWRYHLFQWVIEYLQSAGHSSPEQIVARDSWGEPRRRKFANKVVDEMDRAGKVKELYRDFRQEVERARDAKQARFAVGSP